MTRIWDSLSKPPDLTNATMEDYFDLAFTTLPHKVRMIVTSYCVFLLIVVTFICAVDADAGKV
jgi:hypothetical protein